MRTLILTLGTRGDLELFLLLARTLHRRGHAVHVITSSFHASRVLDAGIECSPVGSISEADLNALLARLTNEPDLRKRTIRYVEQFLRPELAAARPVLEAQTATADYFVSNIKIAMARNGTVLPTAFVTYDPPAALDELDRYSMGLPRDRVLELVAFPKDLIDPQNTWSPRFRFTGFWLASPREETLPESVEQFLSAGEAPVVLTTGSMRMFDPSRLAKTFEEALAQLGRRGILLNSRPFTVEIPYSAIFPRAAAIIHHGSAGATAEVLRAGKPSIVLPQILAQQRMADLLLNAGLASAAFDPATVSVDALAAAIRQALAADIREVTVQDDGIESAANEIERHSRTVTTI